MEPIILLLILLLKSDEFSPTIKPIVKTLLDNKELISLLLEKEGTKKEEPPPREEGTASFAFQNFLDQYVK